MKLSHPIERLFSKSRRADLLVSSWMAQKTRSHTLLLKGSTVLARAGDGLVWLIIGLLILFVGTPGGKGIVFQVASSVLLTALLVTGIKFSVRRERPQGTESARWSSLPQYDIYSFPSGHAARVACIAAGVSMAHPVLRLPFVVWAIGVCCARVALAAHYLLDVLAGILIGVLTANLVARVWPSLILFAR